MGPIANEVRRAGHDVHAVIVELSVEAAATIRKELRRKYTRGYRSFEICDNLLDHVAIHDPQAWTWVGDFVTTTRTIILFEEDERVMFEFENGADIVPVLAESFGFEFYLTNAQTDYIVCFNHHDYLLATGEAAVWLKRRIQST